MAPVLLVLLALLLQPASQVEDLVIHAESGRPIAGAVVQAIPSPTFRRVEPIRALTGADGTGTISGQVTDEKGKPVKDQTVWFVRPHYYEDKRVIVSWLGVRSENHPRFAKTDKKGEYLAEGLLPGLYYVSVAASSRPSTRYYASAANTCMEEDLAAERSSPIRLGSVAGLFPSLVASMARMRNGPPMIYFPGEPTVEAALAVRLNAGEAVTANIRVTPLVADRRLRGEVVDPTGKRVKGARMTLIPQANIFDHSKGFCGAEAGGGSFDIINVRPGSYFLLATVTGKTGPELAGRISVDVTGDVKDLKVVVKPRLELKGVVTVEGNPAGAADIEVRLVPQIPFVFPGRKTADPWSVTGKAAPDGRFTLSNVVPWDYTPTLSLPSSGMYLQAVRFGGIDVSGGFRLEDSGGVLAFVVGRNGGSVAGSVSRADGTRYAGAAVVLVPPLGLRERHDLYKPAQADASGRFLIEGIAPGDYAVYFWNIAEENAWRDPEFLRLHEEKASPVRVEPGGRLNLNLRF